MVLSERHGEILSARGLDLELLAKLGVESSSRLPGDCIAIPYTIDGKVVNHKYRTIGETKEFMQDKGGLKCFWNFDALADPALRNDPLLITEGEFDAMVAIQSGYARTVSVPDGAPAEIIGEDSGGAKYGYLDHAKDALKDVPYFILAVDADGPGANLLHDLSIRLGRHRCKWVPYPKGCKDLGDAQRLFGGRGVKETIARQAWIKISGVYRMSELPPLPPVIPHEIGIVGLNAHYRMRLGDLCVITGIPGHGKSTLLNEIAYRMAMKHRWPTVFASFEQRPQIDHRRNLRTLFNERRVIYQTPIDLDRADHWIEQMFTFLVPDEDEDVTLKWMLEHAAAAIVRHGSRIVVVDPWNEMDHDQPPDMTVTQYTGFAIKQFRKLAKKYNVHVIIAAHPTKQRKNEDGTIPMPTLYDISDSAHWYNKSEVGIIVHRLDKEKTVIRIARSKYHDEIGVPGDLFGIFDPETNRYTIVEPEAYDEPRGGRRK